MRKRQRTAIIEPFLPDLFDDTLLTESHDDLRSGRVAEGMRRLQEGLLTRRLSSSDQEWNEFVLICRQHPLNDLLLEDPFTSRAALKPRGYAGDAVLMDLIYSRDEPAFRPGSMSGLGAGIFEYSTESPAAAGVRARRRFIAALLDETAAAVDQPHVLSVGAGHARECLLSRAVRDESLGRFVALDSDTETLWEVEQCYGELGVEALPATVRQLVGGRVDVGRFDLIYSSGLYDYLQANLAQRLTEMLFEMLNPGGKLLVANFLPGIRDVGYMESFMDWKLVYRSRVEMMEVAALIPNEETRDLRVFTEQNQNIVFLEINKKRN